MLDAFSFFFFRRTERPDRTGTIKSCLMEIDITVDGDGHVSRTNTLLLCRGMRKRLSFVAIWLASPKILDGPKHAFQPKNGTNGHEQPRSVPSGSTRSNRVNTRRHPLSRPPSPLPYICVCGLLRLSKERLRTFWRARWTGVASCTSG